MLRALVILMSFGILARSQKDCGSHKENESYKASDCSMQYYECVNGQEVERQCADGTVFDPDISQCNHPEQVPACSSVVIVDCKEENGNPVSGFSYTKSADCNDGIYYTCSNGVEITEKCPSGMIYDKSIEKCNEKSKVKDCTANSIDSESEEHVPTNPSTTTITDTKTTKKNEAISTISVKTTSTTTASSGANKPTTNKPTSKPIDATKKPSSKPVDEPSDTITSTATSTTTTTTIAVISTVTVHKPSDNKPITDATKKPTNKPTNGPSDTTTSTAASTTTTTTFAVIIAVTVQIMIFQLLIPEY